MCSQKYQDNDRNGAVQAAPRGSPRVVRRVGVTARPLSLRWAAREHVEELYRFWRMVEHFGFRV